MSDIFQEVDEEVRRDKAAEFWKKYQNLIYAGAAVIVLATAGYRFYDYRQTEARQAAGEAFQQALKFDHEGNTAEAQASLAKLGADAPKGYRMLARFVTAAETEKSDPKAGAAAFDALANDSSVEPLYREAARLRAALARLDAGDTDAAKSALETLAAPNGVYRQTARLTLASLALQDKDYVSAGKWLDAVVSDFEAPEAEKRAAETLLGVVASNAPTAK
jgi:hypothetical protein